MIALRPAIEGDDDDSTTSGLEVIRASPMSQVVFRDTHICPVGEVCPPDIVVTLRGERRCGSCPLACKTVDHLPAIVAKQRLLLESLQISQDVYRKLCDRGDQQSELSELHDAIDADVQEYFGWRLAEEILDDILSKGGEEAGAIHATEPEIVRRHLRRVVRTSSKQAFILKRIVEANHYPTMATERLRFQALKLRKRILAGSEIIEEADHADEDDIAVLASYVSTFLKANNATFEDLILSLQQPLGGAARTPVLLAASSVL